MLSRSYRLSKKDIDRVFKKGRGVFGPILRIKFFSNRTDHPRYAVTVSNKVAPKAVTRNRLRRKTYEILGGLSLRSNLDIAINYQKLPEEVQIKPALVEIFQKSGII